MSKKVTRKIGERDVNVLVSAGVQGVSRGNFQSEPHRTVENPQPSVSAGTIPGIHNQHSIKGTQAT